APIFHVNGDDPEAVIFATRIALDYRNQFKRDVVIDLVCYRRHGHNEADEPAVTQPGMYSKIRLQQPVRAKYADKLIAENTVSPEAAQQLVSNYRRDLEHGLIVSRPLLCDLEHRGPADWHRFDTINWDDPTNTAIPAERIQQLGDAMLTFPEDWELHPRVSKIMENRRRMINGDLLADWGFAENLAYASLLDDGFPIRISGQDCRRGTFFHRHAMVRDQISNKSYVSLQHLADDQPNFTIIDSVLSEEGVLAFEYGYSTAEPNTLTIWEAQFGDFANGAQVVIDQFIASAGAKWGLYCGLVMFLPHGYEGQGPEHSSARLERYMQLCAEQNVQICVPTTPAQIFHLLRRQMLRRYLRPLIVFTPKSLLRHKLATSSLDSLITGRFQTVIPEVDSQDKSEVTQVIMCTGKIYYELLEARRARALDHVAIIRLEQLYPFPRNDFEEVIAEYHETQTFVWCQEEPQNQGAWDQIKHRFSRMHHQGKAIYYVGRRAAAAPSTGFSQVHQQEQNQIVDDALNGVFDPIMNKRMF
ncbi:MAG: 2-oxoglutarate dehydrogenase E1 component, partial [bacterium]